MANWAFDFLLRNPELAGRPIQRHRHALSFELPSGERQSFFVGSPAHYWDATDGWQPLDTALRLIGYGVRCAGPGDTHRP